MATLNREQIIKYIRTLENKVKKYAIALKKRDQEINHLRTQLQSFTKEQVIKKPENGITSSEDSSPKTEFKQQNKVNPLEERPKTFTEKADIGADQRAKDAMRGKKDKDAQIDLEPPSGQNDDYKTAVDYLKEINEEEEEGNQSEKTKAPDAFTPTISFTPGAFLCAVLEGEEEADEAKALLEQLHNCEQDEKRNILRSLTTLHWRMVHSMGKRLYTENLPWEKRLFMRYGMVDDKLMANRMDVWEQLYLDTSKPGDTGIYYIDEWLDEIAKGNLKYSTIDEMALEGAKPDQNATGEEALRYELINVPQMQRLAVGPRANSISILVQEYCVPSRDNPIITRQWLQEAMKHCLKCDYKMFHRRYKVEDKIVQPLFIICPGYGQKGGCWEPWSTGRKGDTGPRICLCAFPPRNSMKALLYGLADYRWEFAKADAMHYWLTEGLTGKWLALFSRNDQRKDLKKCFIDNYILWVTKEAYRIPKLEKRFREFFWHNIPFSEEIKQNLKGGGMFGRLIELEEAKKRREEEERRELERIKAEREARRAARNAKLEGD